MRAVMAARPPSEAMGAFARGQAGLAASVPAGIAPAMTALPDAELLDLHGAATTMYAATSLRWWACWRLPPATPRDVLSCRAPARAVAAGATCGRGYRRPVSRLG
jgi:hypothetical protein